GAVDFIEKPTHQASRELLKIRDELLYKVGMAAQVSINRIKTLQVPAVATPPAKLVVPATTETEFSLVAIGASTGGPSALQTVLSMLPPDIPSAVVISQHMPPGFTKTFAGRLNKFSPFEVKEAENGDIVRPGRVLISPGGFNMTFIKNGASVAARLLPGEDLDRYVPSINRMFVSASELFGSRAVAVVMTGMGNDGKEGVVKIKSAGGKIIAQSEDTSVIFGMPREAIATGVVDLVLPLQGIAEGIVQCAKQGKK
ncbi:MAG: chemotaxis protein CheB, partial [Deltaproteobacteria bacterium]